MPTYEYACRSCGAHIEVYQRFSDPPLTECNVCGGPLRKVFHPAGILFKGSGFYATDSRRSASDGSRSEGAEPSKEPASKGGEPGPKDKAKEPAASKTAVGSNSNKTPAASKKEPA